MTLITSLPVKTSTAPADVLPIVEASSNLTKQITVANLIPALFYANVFGNGSDGAAVLDGTTTYTGFSSLAGSTYTLTRDVQASSLTVNSGVTVLPGPFRVFCTGTVTFSSGSAVASNGGNGNANGTAGTASSTSAGLIGVGPAGGAGNTGAGAGGTRTGFCVGMNGGGGAGGTGSSGAGGSTPGTLTGATWPLTAFALLLGYASLGGNSGQVSGGISGGGGGGDGTNKGGGGGGGGGVICVFAHAVVAAGRLAPSGVTEGRR